MKILLMLALALASMSVNAQTVVLTCGDPWGGSFRCGGCDDFKWRKPDANSFVQSSANEYWVKLGSLASSAPVSVSTSKKEGDTTSDRPTACAGVTGVKTAGELLGLTSTPSPPIPSPPTQATGSTTLNWGAPLINIDGSALTNLSGYRISYWLGTNPAQSLTVGPAVNSYTLTGLAAGNWSATVTTLAGTAESQPSNPVNFTVSAPTTPPPPTSKWVVAPVSSNSRPIYEAVLNAAGSALVRGNPEGKIASGKPCAAELFKVSTNSYRLVQESDALLASPTYKGRQHVAICTLAP